MRRVTIAVLAVMQSLVVSGIVACSFQLAQTIRSDASIARVAHVVLRTGRALAYDVRITIRRRA